MDISLDGLSLIVPGEDNSDLAGVYSEDKLSELISFH